MLKHISGQANKVVDALSKRNLILQESTIQVLGYKHLNDLYETNAYFKEAYEAMFGNPPENAFAALGYDTLKVLAKAIEIAGTDDPKSIPEGLSQIKDFQGVSGVISYKEGSQIPDKSVAIIEVKNGKFATIKQITPQYLPDPKIAK